MNKDVSGVGAILVVDGYPGKYVFLPSGEENGGKIETWEDYTSGFSWQLLELIGGAVDENESLTEAIIREAREERELGKDRNGLDIEEKQIMWLDQTIEIHQFRPEKGEVDFLVGLAMITLKPEQLAWLLIKYQARIYSKIELNELITFGLKEGFRPFAWGVINLMVNDLNNIND